MSGVKRMFLSQVRDSVVHKTAQLIIPGSIQSTQVIDRNPNIVLEDLALNHHDEEVMDGDWFVLDAVKRMLLNDVVVLVELKLQNPMFDGFGRLDVLAELCEF